MRLTAYTLEPEMSFEESIFLDALVAGCAIDGYGLEIGTAAGGSLCRMIRAAKQRKFVAIDPMTYFPDQLETVRRNLARNSIDPALVETRISTSDRARRDSFRLREEFAFILIDGKHDTLNVMRDLLWTRLLKVGGIVCLHDYTPARPGPYKAINDFIQLNANAYQAIGQVGSLLALQKTSANAAHSFPASAWIGPWRTHIAVSATKALRHARRRTREALRVLGGKRKSYESHVIQRLSLGKPHQTLGASPISDGSEDFAALLALGIKAHHRVLDFGCGSLRVGRWLIGYLTQGQYWGLDPSERLIRLGLDRWYRDDALPTNARLGAITSQSLDLASKAGLDLILVLGVLQSVAPKDLASTFAQIAQCCGPRCRVIVTLLEARRYVQLGRHAHRHAFTDIERAAASAGLALRILQQGHEPDLLRHAVSPSHVSRATSIMMWPKNATAPSVDWDVEAALAKLKTPVSDQARTEPRV